MDRSTFFAKAKAYAVAHKAVSAAIALVVIGGGYGIYKHQTSAAAPTKYILAAATKGTLISTVSGSGQVAANDQVTVTSMVSGQVTSVRVADGDAVRAGQVLATIDATDAAQAVANAKISLENAQLSYQKALQDASIQSATSTSSDIVKAYESGYNAIVAASVDMPTIFTTMDNIYYSTAHSPYFSDVNINAEADTAAVKYKEQAGAALDAAKAEYNADFMLYKNISQNSSRGDIISLLNETTNILNKLLSALSGTYSTLDYIQGKMNTVPAQLTTDKNSISTYVSQINSDSNSISTALSSIENSQTSGTGASISVQSAALAVNQAQLTLNDDQTALANHYIAAPFDGIVAKAIAKLGDQASGNTQIATIVTSDDVIDISLNELDAAKVAKGDKVTITFDAIDGLSLTGHVSDIDLVGTVSQGVVSYGVQIALDTMDPRVKPGMTANASIITSVKQDVLTVPSSAVKTQGGASYVQELDQRYDASTAAAGVTSATAPISVPVTVGATNSSQVEIASGLNEGDQVISRAVAASTKTSATPSILSGLGGGNRAIRAGN